jgi:hypothetical protein
MLTLVREHNKELKLTPIYSFNSCFLAKTFALHNIAINGWLGRPIFDGLRKLISDSAAPRPI